MKNINKRKFLGTIVGIILFSCLALYFTYARYEWRSSDTSVTINFEDVMLEFENGGNVNVSNIGPVLNYTDGVKANFTATSIAGEIFPFVVKLNITSISETLLVESFKYKLMRDTSGGTNYTEEVASGDFSTFGVRQNIIYVETMAPDSKYSYQFIVYIDGNMANDNNMQQNNLISTLLVTDDDAITDYSGNGNHAVNMGATWDMSEGTITTDGVDDFINCGLYGHYFDTSASLVIRVKFYTELTTSRDYSMFGNWAGGGGGLYWSNIYKNFAVSYWREDNAGYFVSRPSDSISLVLDKWYTIVGTFNQGIMSLYVDGEKVSEATSPSIYTVPNGMPFFLGADPGIDDYTPNEMTPAIFDAALIFDRALTETEIAADYAGVINPTNKTELLAYYTFDY